MLRGQLNQIHISELHNRLLIAVEHWIAAQSIPVAPANTYTALSTLSKTCLAASMLCSMKHCCYTKLGTPEMSALRCP